MSPVIAFDIAVVAQKVRVQFCYIMADMLNPKKWVVVVVVITYRSVWLLELLTEPINLYKNVGTTNFCPCFGRSKSGEGDQMRSVFKIMRCSKEQIWPQFSKHLFQNESVAYHRL